MKKINYLLMMCCASLLFSQCKIVRQGEVGVKRTMGKLSKKEMVSGPRFYNPFTSKIIIVPTQSVNLEVNLELPSKEGVNVSAEISILYRVKPKMATYLIENVGTEYEKNIIMPVFRASAADVSSKFMAKDMHTGNRQVIETEIKKQMMVYLDERGIEIESVLLKSIKLPKGLYRAIEEKLEAEQEAQRMEFVLQRERQEADRKKVEAEGIRNANKIIAEGLTPEIIKYKSLETFNELSKSPNSKVIITDGKTPFLINE